MAERIDENSKSLGRFFYSPDKLVQLQHENKLKEQLFQSNIISAPTVLIRTKALWEIGKYDEDLMYEDWDLWLRFAYSVWKIGFEFKVYCKYRVHKDALTYDKSYKMLSSTYKLFRKNNVLSTTNAVLFYFNFYNNISREDKRRFLSDLYGNREYKMTFIYTLVSIAFYRKGINKLYKIWFLN